MLFYNLLQFSTFLYDLECYDRNPDPIIRPEVATMRLTLTEACRIPVAFIGNHCTVLCMPSLVVPRSQWRNMLPHPDANKALTSLLRTPANQENWQHPLTRMPMPQETVAAITALYYPASKPAIFAMGQLHSFRVRWRFFFWPCLNDVHSCAVWVFGYQVDERIPQFNCWALPVNNLVHSTPWQCISLHRSREISLRPPPAVRSTVASVMGWRKLPACGWVYLVMCANHYVNSIGYPEVVVLQQVSSPLNQNFSLKIEWNCSLADDKSASFKTCTQCDTRASQWATRGMLLINARVATSGNTNYSSTARRTMRFCASRVATWSFTQALPSCAFSNGHGYVTSSSSAVLDSFRRNKFGEPTFGPHHTTPHRARHGGGLFCQYANTGTRYYRTDARSLHTHGSQHGTDCISLRRSPLYQRFVVRSLDKRQLHNHSASTPMPRSTARSLWLSFHIPRARACIHHVSAKELASTSVRLRKCICKGTCENSWSCCFQCALSLSWSSSFLWKPCWEFEFLFF